VAHTTRLTALAAALVRGKFGHLHSTMLHHAAEEAGHDQLLLADMADLGASTASHPPFAITTAFWQSLHFQIEHQHALAIFGRILPLEGLAAAVGAKLCARAARAHGESATRFLSMHGAADPEHIANALAALSDVDAEESALISEGVRLTVTLYRTMLDEVAVVAGGS
jgi:hypothetical protein